MPLLFSASCCVGVPLMTPVEELIGFRLPGKPVAGDYLDRILGPARDHGFPQWYIDRLESFRA